MRYCVFDQMNACTEAEVQRLLPLVSKQRREQALRFHHLFGQFTCLKSYVMLCELLSDSALPPFVYNAYGQPALPTGYPYFSISHCTDGIAVAVSEYPVGIDIESIRGAKDGLIAYTMNAEEQQRIQLSSQPEREFIRLWTQKEAVLKMQGTGIVRDLKQVLVVKETDYRLETIDDANKPYIISIATLNNPSSANALTETSGGDKD